MGETMDAITACTACGQYYKFSNHRPLCPRCGSALHGPVYRKGNYSSYSDDLNLPNMGYLRLPDVLRLFPVSKSTWWNGVKDGKFPQPVKLTERTTAWRVEDIRNLIEAVGGE